MSTQNEHKPPLTIADVHKVARLARLDLSDTDAVALTSQLTSILNYMDRLRSLDLTSIEPMTSPLDMFSRLDDDAPGPTLSNQTLMDMAPDTMPPFIRVPRVLPDDHGGAA